jgi:hypothetical protein
LLSMYYLLRNEFVPSKATSYLLTPLGFILAPYGRKDVAPRMLRIAGQKDITYGSSIRRFQESSRPKVS